MTTTRQAQNARFQAGSGCYVCRVCGHNTRSTGGDGASVKLCDTCFELAGEDNHISDNGTIYGSKAGVTQMLAILDKRSGVGTAQRCFPQVCKAAEYGLSTPRLVIDYLKCREEGFGVTESIRTAVSLNPEVTKVQAMAELATAGCNPATVRIQYANSRRIDAEMAAELTA